MVEMGLIGGPPDARTGRCRQEERACRKCNRLLPTLFHHQQTIGFAVLQVRNITPEAVTRIAAVRRSNRC